MELDPFNGILYRITYEPLYINHIPVEYGTELPPFTNNPEYGTELPNSLRIRYGIPYEHSSPRIRYGIPYKLH